MKMPKRRTHEDVAQFYRDNGCELIDTFINVRTSMRYRCKCGNESKTCFESFKNHPRCSRCKGENTSGHNHYRWREDKDEMKRQYNLTHIGYMIFKYIRNKKYKHFSDKRVIELVGYSYEDAELHLQNHPDWNRVKNFDWHIDHAFPVSAFFEYGISDLKIIHSLDNIRPTLKQENLDKAYTYDKVKFEAWLTSKGVKYESKLQ